MADRYWVGGTANWDATAGTKWALTSGGAGGEAVPTAADDVFFDVASGVVTCTISGSRVAKSINCTGFTGTLAGSGDITMSGSVTLDAGMTFTYTGTWRFIASATITSAGKTISGGVSVDGNSITVQLADALNLNTGRLEINRGTFTTNNYNITAGDWTNNVSFVQTINLGASTLTLSSNFPTFLNGNANLTLNAGTSTVVLTGSSARLNNSGTLPITLANVSYTSGTVDTRAVIGLHTFNNLTVSGPASAGVVQFTFNSRQTINGTLSTTGTAGNRRVWFRGVTYGLAQTLTINSAPSLTDADFRDIYVIGTAAPISGTRVGDLRGCRGITFDTPKNCYRIGTGNWSDNQWSDTSGGSPNTDFFPLAQDTAVFNQSTTAGTHTMNSAVPYTGSVDMSARTSALTLSITAFAIYGNWTNGSGTTLSGSGTLTYSGRNTQTITSAGKTFGGPITVDSYGGSVELADALNIGGNPLTVTNGTFDTKSYNVTASELSSSNSNVRTITLGSSTVTLSGGGAISFSTSTNLTFNAGTSTISITSSGNISAGDTAGSGLTFYNVTWTASISSAINGTNTFNNVTVNAPSSAGFVQLTPTANQTITGTLTVAGASPVRRLFVRSFTLGTQRTLNVGTLSADDCDFRDIAITGTAAGSSPTRAGDCGGNSGITFPAAKTVYWNLAGAQNWSATAWAPSSGGTPDINNFPLAQDTAVFDEAVNSVTGAITINAAWNIGTFDASARTSAMTLTTGSNAPFVYGDWKFGTGVTSSSSTGTINFGKRGTQTITSNGVTFGCPLTIDGITGTVQLADALSLGSTRTLLVTRGTFDAVSYNVTTGLFRSQTVCVVKMGSGTWTISGTGSVWSLDSTNVVFYKGTANIVLSDTSAAARTFSSAGFSYNKLTIGGTTGISTLTITGNNQFTELASTKTVAHTIALGSTTQTFGKWTVTGTLGNVVTLTGTGTSHILAGACTDGIDYLAMGSIGFAATSPGEFYAGANSTGTAAAPVYRTAKPADSTRYWVGGTGNWSDTARWSDASGGSSGFSVPRSHDDVVFDSASNATAYTATVDAVTGGIRMKSLTIAGPASGNVTLAGSTAMVGIHGNVTLPATGLTRTYTGTMTLSSNSTGLTFTTNGAALASNIIVNGVDCSWTLGSAMDLSAAGGGTFTLTNGSFSLSTYNFTLQQLVSNNGNSCTINFGSGTVSLSGSTAINFGTTETNRANLTVTASTSQINCSSTSTTFSGNNQTFYNVSFTSTSAGTVTLNGANSFNNLSFTGITSAGLKNISLTANQTVTGTLTFSAGTNATMRHFCRSDTIGTTRTITAAAVSMTDVDFRDITIAGAAAPASGTRIGDCKGNSGITFDAAANKYWNLAAGGNWGGAIAWATSSGGTPDINNFPLAQDTCFFEATGLNSGATVTINAAYNIGTIDMSARTTNTMTLTAGIGIERTIYGNWINGTGTTVAGSSLITFAGRSSQTITSAGKTFIQAFVINSPGGSVTLQDALVSSNSAGGALTITNGTFDAATYSVTLSSSSSGVSSNNSNTRTIAVGSGTWTLAGTNGWVAITSTNLTVTGTGTISLTSASAKTFAGGSVDYSGITLNQGGVGTLSITGNNTFKTISSTAAGANTINMGTTTQRITTSWTASGSAGNILTVTGTSASSPGTLIFTGSGQAADVDYLTVTGVRAYNLDSTWYAGANSTNNGSLGWLFEAPGGTVFNVDFSDTATGSDALTTTATLGGSFSDTASGSDALTTTATLGVSFSDTATGSDALTATVTLSGAFSDTATGSDALTAIATLSGAFSDTATGSDAISASATLSGAFSDTATGSDALTTTATLSGAFSDTATGTDTFTVAASTFNPAFSDTASGSDALTAIATLNVSLSDSATLTDAAAALMVFPAAFSDTATAEEFLQPGFAFNVSFSDTATGSDAFAVAASIFNPAFSDTATGSDTLAVAASAFNTAFSDTATGADTFSVAASSFVVAFSDTATGADTFAVAASIFTPAFSDTATGTDALAAAAIFPVEFSDTATGADALTAQVVFVSAVSELANGTDATAVAASIFNPAFSDTATGADTFSVAASTFGVSLSDTATGSDAPAASLVLPAAFSDTATGSDALAAQMVFPAAFSDTATGADALTTQVVFVSAVSELVTGLDAFAVAASTFNVSLSETATGLDEVSPAGSTFNVSLSDSGTITDLVVGGYLWNPVDDTQSANWQNVITAQTPAWTEITNTQGPNWVEIQT